MSKYENLLRPGDVVKRARAKNKRLLAGLPEKSPRRQRPALPAPCAAACPRPAVGSIDATDAARGVLHRRGVLLDVRDGDGCPPLTVEHHRIALSDIERFMAGTLNGEHVQRFVSLLLALAAKWRAVYLVGYSEDEARAAARHLERLGLTDLMVVTEDAHKLWGARKAEPGVAPRLCACA